MKELQNRVNLQKITTFLNKPFVFPVLLFVITFIAYGLKINHMGFYWDDWEAVLLYNLNIPHKYIEFFAIDRPTWAWIYAFLVPILEVSPQRWMIFMIFIRWLGVLGLYIALSEVWSNHNWQLKWVSILLIIYPGFMQSPLAADYSRHFLIFAFYSLSLAFMVFSITRKKHQLLYAFIAVLFSFVQIMTFEYYMGLELIRPILLWILLRENGESLKVTFLKTFKKWIPYIGSIIIFLIWRFGYFRQVSDENAPYLLENIINSPLQTIRQIIQLSIQDFIHSHFLVFANAIDVKSIEFRTIGSYISSLIIGLLLVGWFILLKDKANNSKKAVIQGLLVGILAFVFGGLPIWSTNRQIVIGIWSDRFVLAPMVGVALFIVFLVEWLLENKQKKAILLGALIVVSFAFQLRNTQKYQDNWQIQKDYYWELYWRAPALAEGTAILGPKMPFSLIGDYSAGVALNTIYAGELTSTDAPYWFINTSRYLGWDIFPDYEENLPIEYTYRNVEFRSNTSNGLGVTNDSGRGCLIVIDNIYEKVPGFTEYEYELFNVSHVDQIIVDSTNEAKPPEQIFGTEKKDNWCYYFEKADLARQMQDWEQITNLGDEAEMKGLRTKKSLELIPFIEGYARAEKWEKALSYTDTANRLVALMQPALCQTWERIKVGTAEFEDSESYVEEAFNMLECSSLGK